MKRWNIEKTDEKLLSEILMRTDLNSLCGEILSARNLKSLDEVEDFFRETQLEDPYALIDMDKAVELIMNAVEEGELICIYGDYDCDGVTSTVVLYSYLENIGASVMYYIPERDEGYGLNKAAIDKIKESGCRLIITVDNGITAIEEAEYISELGMNLVVTDHHQPTEKLPKAGAIINLHRNDCPSIFKDLCGVGVVLKLCAALDEGNYEAVLEQYCDLVAIGTIADVVPLVGENRTIVKYGLNLIKNTENYGLISLIDKCGFADKTINSTSIAFGIAPKINAAGRFGSPLSAVKTLLSEDEDDAEDFTEHLMNLNNLRRQKETEILDEILSEIDRNPSVLNDRVLVFSGYNWHHGVIGIIANKILEMFGKPSIIISIEGETARGSARSIKGFNIFECFEFCSDTLIKYGGHECAGGITVAAERISEFKEKIREYTRYSFNQMPRYSIKVDKLLRSSDLTVEKVKSLELLEPFGEGNPQPIFGISGARLDKLTPLSNGKHTRLEFTYDNSNISALLFFVSPEETCLNSGDIIDMLVTLEINEYNGKSSVSVKVKDYRLHTIRQDKYFAAKDCYESIQRNEPIDERLKAIIVPDNNELKSLLDYIKNLKSQITVDMLYSRIANDKFNYCKFRNCLDVYEELGMIKIEYSSGIITYSEKSFENSDVLRRLKSL